MRGSNLVGAQFYWAIAAVEHEPHISQKICASTRTDSRTANFQLHPDKREV